MVFERYNSLHVLVIFVLILRMGGSELQSKLQIKDSELQMEEILFQDPNYGIELSKEAFNRAESWRQIKVNEIYANVSDDELGNATRWLSYANLFADEASCSYSHTASSKSFWIEPTLLADIIDIAQSIWNSNDSDWNDNCRRGYLTLHAYHTTGIEGNTLTLSETNLVIKNISLFLGILEDNANLVKQTSIQEVRNIHQVLDTLKLSYPMLQLKQSIPFSKLTLIDINAAIVRDTTPHIGFRLHSVGVGHQLIVLPMPDEIDTLITMYLEWLNIRLTNLLLANNDPLASVVTQVLALACEAHTKFVHIHPFADGNGRLSRIISGLVLQRFLLPAPMFLKEQRNVYIEAVSAATMSMDYSKICNIHAEAVLRSLQATKQLLTTVSK